MVLLGRESGGKSGLPKRLPAEDITELSAALVDRPAFNANQVVCRVGHRCVALRTTMFATKGLPQLLVLFLVLLASPAVRLASAAYSVACIANHANSSTAVTEQGSNYYDHKWSPGYQSGPPSTARTDVRALCHAEFRASSQISRAVPVADVACATAAIQHTSRAHVIPLVSEVCIGRCVQDELAV